MVAIFTKIIIAIVTIAVTAAIITPILVTQLKSKHKGVVIINIHGLNDEIINIAKKDKKIDDILKHSKINHLIYQQEGIDKDDFLVKFFSSDNLEVDNLDNKNVPFTKLLHHKDSKLELISNLNLYDNLGKVISLPDNDHLDDYSDNEITSNLIKTNLSLIVSHGKDIFEDNDQLNELRSKYFNASLDDIKELSENHTFPLSIIMDKETIDEKKDEFLNLTLSYLVQNSSFNLFKDKKLTLLETDIIEKSLADKDIVGAVANFKKILKMIKQWDGYKSKNIMILSIPSEYEIIPDDNDNDNTGNDDSDIITDDNQDDMNNDNLEDDNVDEDDDDMDTDDPIGDLIDEINKDNCISILHRIKEKTSIEIDERWCDLWNMLKLLKKIILDRINKKLGMTVHLTGKTERSVTYILFGKIKKIELKKHRVEELGDYIAKFLKFKLIKEHETEDPDNQDDLVQDDVIEDDVNDEVIDNINEDNAEDDAIDNDSEDDAIDNDSEDDAIDDGTVEDDIEDDNTDVSNDDSTDDSTDDIYIPPEVVISPNDPIFPPSEYPPEIAPFFAPPPEVFG